MADILTRENLLQYIQDNSADLTALVLQTEVASVESFQYSLMTAAEQLDGTVITREQLDSWLTEDDIRGYLPDVARRFEQQQPSIEGPQPTQQFFEDFQRNATDPFAAVKSYARSFSAPSSAPTHDLSNRANNVASSYQEFADFQGSRLNANVEGRLRALDQVTQHYQPMSGFAARPTQYDWYSLFQGEGRDQLGFVGTVFQTQQTDVVSALLRRSGPTQMITQGYREGGDSTSMEILLGNDVAAAAARQRDAANPRIRTLQMDTPMGSLHAKLGAFYDERGVTQLAFIGGQNITPALERTTTIEDMVVFNRATARDPRQFDVVSREIRAAAEVMLDIQSSQGVSTSNDTIRNQFQRNLNARLGSHREALFVNQEIHNRVRQTIQETAESPGRKLILSMQYIESALNPSAGNSVLNSSLTHLGTLAERGALSIAVSGTSYSEKLGLFKLLDDLRGINPTDLRNGTMQKAKYDLLQTLIRTDSFTLLPSQYVHSKSLAVLDDQNRLVQFATGSANLSSNSRFNNLETMIFLQGDLLNALEEKDISNIENYYYYGLSTFSRPNQYQGLHVERMGNEAIAQQGLAYLRALGGVETRSGSAPGAPFMFSRRYLIGRGEQRLVGATIEIQSPVAGQRNYSFDVTFGAEHIDGRGELSPVVYLNKTQRTIVGAVFKNGTDQDFRFQAYNEQTGLIETRTLGSSEAYRANAFDVLGGLITTTHYAMGYEARTRGLIAAYNTINQASLRESVSRMLGMRIMIGLQTKRRQVGLPEGNVNFADLTSVLDYVRGLGYGDRKGSLTNASMLLATPLEYAQSLPNYERLNQEDRNWLMVGRANQLKRMIDEADGSLADGVSSSQVSEKLISSFIDVLGRSIKQTFDPGDTNRYTGLYNDLIMSLIQSNDLARMTYTREVKLGVSEAFSLQTDAFAQPHTMNYSQGQQLHDLAVFGLTTAIRNIYNTMLGDTPMGLIMNPYPLQHGESLGEIGEYLRSVGGAQGRSVTVPFTERYGGLNKVEGGAPRVHVTEGLAHSMPTLDALTRRKYKDTLKQVLAGRWADLDINSVIDRMADVTYDWYDGEDEKEKEDQMLYYFPYAKTEQISQRMKNLTSGRVMFDASKEFIRFALSLGTDRAIDLSQGERATISGNVLTAMSSQQFRALKDEFRRRGGLVLSPDKQQALLKDIAVGWSMQDRRAGKGFMGSERPRLLAITAGATQLSDYGLFNPEYRKTRDDYEYGMKFVKPHVIQATGTLSDMMQSPAVLQQLVNQHLLPGTIFLARDIKIQHSAVLSSFRQQIESRVNTLLGLSGSLTGDILSQDYSTIIQNLSARSITTESGEVVPVGRDLAKQALRTAIQQINDENKATRVNVINNRLEFHYQKGIYSPAGLGDNPYEQLRNLQQIGTIYDGDSEFTLFPFSTYEGASTDLRRSPVKVRIPAHSARHLNAFTVLLDASVNVSKSNTYTLDLQTVTLEDFGAGMRHGTIFPKGPFRDAPLELWQTLANWTGGSSKLLPQRLIGNNVQLTAQDFYAMIGPSQIKGFNFEMGLMLLEEQRQSGIYRSIEGTRGGATVAEALGFFFLSRGKVIGDENLKILKGALGGHLIDTGRDQFGQSLLHQAGTSTAISLERKAAGYQTSSLEYFGGLAALAVPEAGEGLESALLRTTVAALGGDTAALERLRGGALHLLNSTFSMKHSLNINKVKLGDTEIQLYTHEDTFATRPTGLLAFLVKASQDIFDNINVEERLRSANMAEVALGKTSAFSTAGISSRGDLFRELGAFIGGGGNYINELRATMQRRMIVDKLSQIHTITGGDITTFLGRISSSTTTISPQDVKVQQLIGEMNRLMGHGNNATPEVVQHLLSLYNPDAINTTGAARVRSVEAYGNMADDVFYKNFGQAPEEIASRFGFKLAERSVVQSILTKVLGGQSITSAEQRQLESVENAFESIRTYLQTQRYILMPAEMMFSKIATPAGNKNVTALEGHIARSLTERQLKMYTYSPNDYTDIGSITEAMITLGMIHEGTMPSDQQLATRYKLNVLQLGSRGLADAIGGDAGLSDYHRAQSFTYRFLSNYTIFSRHALPGMRGVSEVGLGARAIYDFVMGNSQSGALNAMTRLAGITRLPMGSGLSHEEDIARRVASVLRITEGQLQSRFNSRQGALNVVYNRALARGTTQEDFLSQLQERAEFQALSSEERTLYTAYYTERYGGLDHLGAFGRATTAAAEMHRSVIEDHVMQAYNTNNGAEYLEGMKALYKSLDAISNQTKTPVREADARRASMLKQMLRTSHFIALPELTAVSDRDGRIQLRGDHTKSTTGVILGLDILEKMSLLFASESHEALSTQHQLVVKLQQMDNLLNRIQRETFGGRVTSVTSDEQQQLNELQSLMLSSKSSAVLLINNVNSIRQATANRLSMMGASFIAMNSFLVNSTEVAIGRRFDDANAVSRLGGIARILHEFRPSHKMLMSLEDDVMRRSFFLTTYAEEAALYEDGATPEQLRAFKQIRSSGFDPMTTEGAAMRSSVMVTLGARRDALLLQVAALDAIPQPTGAVEPTTLDAYTEGQKNKRALLGRVAALNEALYYAEHGSVRGLGSVKPIYLFNWGITQEELEAREQRTAQARSILDAYRYELSELEQGRPVYDEEGNVKSYWYIKEQNAEKWLTDLTLRRRALSFSPAVDLANKRRSDLAGYKKFEQETRLRYDNFFNLYEKLTPADRATVIDFSKDAVSFKTFRRYADSMSFLLTGLEFLEGFKRPNLGGPIPWSADPQYDSEEGKKVYKSLVNDIVVQHNLAIGRINLAVHRYNQKMSEKTGVVKDHFRAMLEQRLEGELQNQYYNDVVRERDLAVNNWLKVRMGLERSINKAMSARAYASFKKNEQRRFLINIIDRNSQRLAAHEAIDSEYRAMFEGQTEEQRAETEIIHRSLKQYTEVLQMKSWLYRRRGDDRYLQADRLISTINNLKPHYTLSVNKFREYHEQIAALLPDSDYYTNGKPLVDEAMEILAAKAVPGGPEFFNLQMRSVSSPQEASDMIAGYRTLRENLTAESIKEPVYQDIIRVHGIIGTESEGERAQLKRLFRQYEREYYRLAHPVNPDQAQAAINLWATKLQAWARAYGRQDFEQITPAYVTNLWRQGYVNPEHLELQIITGKEVDYSNRDRIRNELESQLLRKGVLVNRQGMPYSAANPPAGDAPGAAGHDAIDILGTLSGRAGAANSLFKPTESSDTLMLISAFGFQFVGLGDYDGDSYQAALSSITKSMGKVAQLRHELSKKEAAISRLQQSSGNNVELTILGDERAQIEHLLRHETDVMNLAIETNRQHAATQDKAVTGLRSYTSSFLALPEELVGDKLLPGVQVFSDRQLGGLVKQFRDTLGGISDRAEDIQHISEAVSYISDFTSKDTLFTPERVAELRELKGARVADRMLQATREWYGLLDLTHQMESIKDSNKLLDEQKEAFLQAINISESARMAVNSASKFLGNITGSQINPADLGSIQAVMGTTGGGLLGKVYNTVVPVVGTMTGDLAMHKVMRNQDILNALKSNLGAMDFSGVADEAVRSALDAIKGDLSNLEVDGEPWSQRMRQLEAKNAVAYRFMLTTQQFLRDAALKPKQAGGLVKAGRAFRLSPDAKAQIDKLELSRFIKGNFASEDPNLIQLGDVTGYSNLLQLERFVERDKSERFLEIISQDFIGSTATTALKYRYGTDPNMAAISTEEQRPMTAFAVLRLLTDYAGSSNMSAAELMNDSIYGGTLRAVRDRVQAGLVSNDPTIIGLRDRVINDQGIVDNDLLVRHVIGDLMGKFQADFISDAVMENYKYVQPEVISQAYAAYGLEVDQYGNLTSNNQDLENTAKGRYLEQLNQYMLHKEPNTGVMVPEHLVRKDYNIGTANWSDYAANELRRAGYNEAEITDRLGRLQESHEQFMTTLQERQRLITDRLGIEVAQHNVNNAGQPIPEATLAGALLGGIQESILQTQMPELVDTLGRVKEFNAALTEVRRDGTTKEFAAVVDAMKRGANAINAGILNEVALSGAFGAIAHATDAGKIVGGDLTKTYAQNYQFLMQAIQDYTQSLGAGAFDEGLAKSIYSYMALGPGMPAVVQETLDRHTAGLSSAQREGARLNVFTGMLRSGAFATIASANAYTAQIAQVRELNTLAVQGLAETAFTPSGQALPAGEYETNHLAEMAETTGRALGVSYEEFNRRGGTVYDPVVNALDSPLMSGYQQFERTQQEFMRMSNVAQSARRAALNIEERRASHSRLRQVHQMNEGMSLLAVPIIFAAMQGDIPITEQVGEAAFNIAQGAITMSTFENTAMAGMFNPEHQEFMQRRMMEGHTRLQYGRLQEYLQNIPSPTEAIFRGVLGEAIFSGTGVLGGYVGQAVDRFRGVGNAAELLGIEGNIPGQSSMARLVTEVAAGSIAMLVSGLVSKRPIPGTLITEDDFAGRMWKQVADSAAAIANYVSQNIMGADDYDQDDFEVIDGDTGETIQANLRQTDASERSPMALTIPEFFHAIASDTDSRAALDELGVA